MVSAPQKLLQSSGFSPVRAFVSLHFTALLEQRQFSLLMVEEGSPLHIPRIIFKSDYFRISSTHTEPSDALAPTLSPVLFQHTSKIPPVPL